MSNAFHLRVPGANTTTASVPGRNRLGLALAAVSAHGLNSTRCCGSFGGLLSGFALTHLLHPLADLGLHLLHPLGVALGAVFPLPALVGGASGLDGFPYGLGVGPRRHGRA